MPLHDGRAKCALCPKIILSAWLLGLSVICVGTPGALAASSSTLEIEVDARDLPRRLLHTRIQVPCKPGRLGLWYPKWIPGTHAPSGPIQDVAGLRFETPDGKAVPWRRDDIDVYRVECDVPDGINQLVARLDVICNGPAVEASGHLSYSNNSVGMINWSNCLLYPDGPSCADIMVHLSLRLPHGWRYATALESESLIDGQDQKPLGDGLATFKTVTLDKLVDSPLIAGEHLRTISLEVGKNPPAFMHLVSESPSALQIGPNIVELYSRMVREAGALFGACHYPEFHFLVTCSDDFGYHGLEHLACSINGVRERDLIEDARRKGWVANLIPHEYVHSWCGKFRRPAGMCTPDFQTPMKTRLLWVYEGLTEYLGEVLMVRSGLVDPKEYRETLAATIGSLIHHEGRKWRPLEDTAVASHLLRGHSPNWNDLRRGQDYYFEGALIWLEADAIIRERSDGKKSLDDFCRKFLGANRTDVSVVPYELPEILSDLHELTDFDWESFFARRVSQPQEALPLEVLGRCGYRLQYATEPPAGSSISRRRGGVSARDSLGITFSPEGRIDDVVPGMAGDRARLAPGMTVIGINNKKFSSQRLHDALADSVARRKIELLLLEGETFRTVVLDYADGPRYLTLVRDPSKPDLLAEILKPATSRPAGAEPRPSAGEAPKPARRQTRSDAAPKGYVCYRATAPIQIDGRIDEDAWKTAPWTDPFVDIEGDVRPRPRFQTRAKLLWDDNYFYVAALLEEPHVWGTLTKHDSVVFNDNDFEIFIDPDGDNQEYYEIEVNALNTEWDLFLKKAYRDGGPAINEWEIPGLKTAVHVSGTLNNLSDLDQSWSVEFAIPWKALAEFARRPTPPHDGDAWRVNFSRVEWRHQIVDGKYRKVPKTPEDNWVWSPQGAIDMHRPERWGYVQFSTAAPGQAAYRPDPAGPFRDRLIEVYHAQNVFFKRNKRWATETDDLKLTAMPNLPAHTTKISLTPDGYEAAITFSPPGGKPETWTIRQDSRIQSRDANQSASRR
jgi:predicted metalloprotease with PDZ domain